LDSGQFEQADEWSAKVLLWCEVGSFLRDCLLPYEKNQRNRATGSKHQFLQLRTQTALQ